MNHSEAGKLGAIKSKPICEANYKIRVDSYYLVPSLCKECLGVIDYKRRQYTFCSQSCSATYNNTRKIKPYKCNGCDNLILTNSSYKKKYCSVKCRTNHCRKSKINENGFLDKVSIQTIRKYLIDNRSHKCEVCKNTEWLGKIITLEIHHIDGNSKNNEFDNLQLLCPNCHSMTDNYKAKNKGKSE